MLIRRLPLNLIFVLFFCSFCSFAVNAQARNGVAKINENGDPINKPIVILKFENGTAVYVKTINP